MNTKNIRTVIIISVCSVIFLLIAAVVILYTVFGIGKDSFDKTYISSIYISDSTVEFDAAITTSADFYSGHSYTLDGDKMYIKVYSSLVKKVQAWPVHIEIKCDTSDIKQIYQDRGSEKVLLWERA